MRRNALAALAAARALGVEPTGALDVELSSCAASAIELPERRRRHQRLLQRQPDVDARRPRRPRRDRARPPRRRARRHARARARRARASTARSATHARAAGVDVLVTVGAARRGCADGYGRGRTRVPDAAAAARARAGARCSPGDTVLVKALARRRPGGRRRGARARRPRMGEVLIAGTASLLICIFLSPKFIEFLRGARVRPAHPRGGAGGPPREGGHADDGRRSSSSRRSRCRS